MSTQGTSAGSTSTTPTTAASSTAEPTTGSDAPTSAGESAGADSTSEGNSSGPAESTAPNQCDATTLKDAGKCQGRLVGTAIGQNHLSNNSLTTIAKAEFDYITAENEMKWSSLQPSRGQFDFAAADAIVNFATQNGMKVKGHTLVWHNQLPSWVSSLQTADEVRTVMVEHINAVMDHFKGKVIAWDVVNEAWANPNDWPSEDEPTLRPSVFYQRLGESFIDEAFVAAREADPDVKLYYNDFRSEAVGQPKGDAIYEMLRGMVERGVPIDGVGLQTHLGLPNDKPAIADIIANMQRIADLGLEVVISELDGHRCDGETLEEQGVRFHDIAAACIAQPACTAFTVWGIGDRDSWLNTWDELSCGNLSPSGLLWDDNLNKKPAYEGVLAGLNGR